MQRSRIPHPHSREHHEALDIFDQPDDWAYDWHGTPIRAEDAESVFTPAASHHLPPAKRAKADQRDTDQGITPGLAQGTRPAAPPGSSVRPGTVTLTQEQIEWRALVLATKQRWQRVERATFELKADRNTEHNQKQFDSYWAGYDKLRTDSTSPDPLQEIRDSQAEELHTVRQHRAHDNKLWRKAHAARRHFNTTSYRCLTIGCQCGILSDDPDSVFPARIVDSSCPTDNMDAQ